MTTIVIAVVTLLVGAVIGYLLNLHTVAVLHKRVHTLPKTPTETMKRVLWVCVGNGFAWVWCSYILAAFDKPQIAEELSKVALAEIIVPVVVYALKSVVENLSKNNNWPDKPQPPPESLEESGGEEANG